MKRKVESEEIRKVKNVPTGEFCKLISRTTQKAKNRVYIILGYDRSLKKYELQAADDMNSYIYIYGDSDVLVGFTY